MIEYSHLLPPHLVSAEFLVARGRAVSSYAWLEQSLVALFASLMNTAPSIAGVAFFRLNNARARNAILAKLLRMVYGSTYNVFFNALITHHLRPLDERRNQIVHWVTVEGWNANPTLDSVYLAPPNWEAGSKGESPRIYYSEMQDFILRCDYLANHINSFMEFIHGKPQIVNDTWRGIFQRPLTYPPQDSHPLYHWFEEHETLLRSFRA